MSADPMTDPVSDHTAGPTPGAFAVLDYGPDAALLELDTQDHVEGLYAHLDKARTEGGLPGVVDVVPAARTVLVVAADPAARAAALAVARRWTPGDAIAHGGTRHEIEVVYDGPDLDDAARQTGLTTEEVVALHAGAEYRVAFIGFSPGFGYLTGLPERLHLPRLRNPRTAVPPRSVAVAGEYSAVYPRVSPGGWNLLGHAVEPMWDESWERPNLLAPGDTVRFVPVSEG